MKIAIIGYGKMGKEVEKIALERGHEIVLKINDQNIHELTKNNLSKANVAIEFSIPSAAIQNLYKCFNSYVPVVSGTTGWLNKFEEVKSECDSNKGGLFYASNFSLGVNIFFKVNEFLAKIMNNYQQYNVNLTEIHHTQKLDEPSGTAISLANDIINKISRKTNWSLSDKSENNILINSIRKDPYHGTHSILYNSQIDNLEIKHEAKSRKGFALGAVLAAEYMLDKTGIHTMDDLLNFN